MEEMLNIETPVATLMKWMAEHHHINDGCECNKYTIEEEVIIL